MAGNSDVTPSICDMFLSLCLALGVHPDAYQWTSLSQPVWLQHSWGINKLYCEKTTMNSTSESANLMGCQVSLWQSFHNLRQDLNSSFDQPQWHSLDTTNIVDWDVKLILNSIICEPVIKLTHTFHLFKHFLREGFALWLWLFLVTFTYIL